MKTEKLADDLLSQAIRDHATDIHITPRSDHFDVHFRIQGKLLINQQISFGAGERLISHLKFMASMDISEKRKPQSGSLQTIILGKSISIRISTLPTAHAKESFVIRLLPQEIAHSYDQLSLFPKTMQVLTSMMIQAHGMIIHTGPTGSGKSTMMYILAEYASTQLNRHVVTLEDPVEIQNDYFVQMQVNEKAGITYQSGLKAILRHDPDIIIIGEIRDAETAMVAIRAAMTGHLVLTSLHAKDTKGAIYRLLEFGVKEHEIKQTVLAITAQRLVSILCPICGQECSKYCHWLRKAKRTGIYEIMHGHTLEQAIEEAKGKRVKYQFQTLQNLIRKGIALGYLPNEEYERWIHDD